MTKKTQPHFEFEEPSTVGLEIPTIMDPLTEKTLFIKISINWHRYGRWSFARRAIPANSVIAYYADIEGRQSNFDNEQYDVVDREKIGIQIFDPRKNGPYERSPSK